MIVPGNVVQRQLLPFSSRTVMSVEYGLLLSRALQMSLPLLFQNAIAKAAFVWSVLLRSDNNRTALVRIVDVQHHGRELRSYEFGAVRPDGKLSPVPAHGSVCTALACTGSRRHHHRPDNRADEEEYQRDDDRRPAFVDHPAAHDRRAIPRFDSAANSVCVPGATLHRSCQSSSHREAPLHPRPAAR